MGIEAIKLGSNKKQKQNETTTTTEKEKNKTKQNTTTWILKTTEELTSSYWKVAIPLCAVSRLLNWSKGNNENDINFSKDSTNCRR